MGALLGELEGGSFDGDPVYYERKALEMGISLHGGSVGQPGVGSSTRGFKRWLKGALCFSSQHNTKEMSSSINKILNFKYLRPYNLKKYFKHVLNILLTITSEMWKNIH